MTRVVIVGAGVSGLSCAFFLEKAFAKNNKAIEIIILEAGDRAGGKIQSQRHANFLVEYGPDSIATRQAAVTELVKELGLGAEVIQPKERSFAIYNKGKMRKVSLALLAPFPKNVAGLFKSDLVSLSAKLRACLGGAASFLTSDKIFSPKNDISLAQYFRRKWGHEMSRYILEPLFSGLYGGNLERVSRRVLHVPTAATGKSSQPPYIGFKNGIYSLIEALQKNLKFTRIQYSESVLALKASDKGLTITSDRQEYSTDFSIITTPAAKAAEIFSSSAPEVTQLLSEFKASDAAIVSLGFKDFIYHPEKFKEAGSGVIIPDGESESIRGITLSSRKWENRAADNHLLVRVFGREGVFEKLGKAKAIELAREQVERFLGLKGEVIYSDLHTWSKGSALCAVGHLERVAELKDVLKKMPGVFLVGAPYGGVGIGDCIAASRATAVEIGQRVA
jgi:oxygen-dependent protoporphyrinogen oxidase